MLRELSIGLLAATVYFGGRVLVEGDTDTATRNAGRIIDLERSLGIDIERPSQELVLDREPLRLLGNLSYVWLHWPLLIAVLLYLFHRSRPRYLQLLQALIVSGLVGLVLFGVFPVAPPRFMPGFDGTVSDAARRHYLDYPLTWTNQLASFPSFHAGWTLIACLAVAATIARRRLKLLALAPAVLVALAVVTTGNHYVIDAVAGTIIAVGAYVIFATGRTSSRFAAAG